MTLTPELGRWEALVASRSRGEADDGIAFVLGLLGVPGLISFAGGFPDPATFPRERVSALFQEFAASGEASAFQYAPTRGLAGPLDALAGRLERLQGRRPAADELLITSGAIEALELVAKSFIDPGDVVVVEGPTYLGAIQAFRSYEATLVAVPLDEHGLDLDDLERRLASGLRPKLLYTIPDHQNPAGVSLAADRRALLVELASRYGFLVVEDVAYRELGFGDEPLPSLWSLAPDVVVQTGTTSKTLFPGFGSAGRSARPRSPPGSSPPSRTPISARERWGSGSSRSRFGAAGWTSRSYVRGRCTGPSASGCLRRSSGRCRQAPTGPGRRAASSPG